MLVIEVLADAISRFNMFPTFSYGTINATQYIYNILYNSFPYKDRNFWFM